MTLEMDAPLFKMKTAFADPVSASVSQACPRSNSLFPKSTEPEIVEAFERETMLPDRVGMLSVWAEAKEAKRPATTVVVKCMSEDVYEQRLNARKE